MHPETTTDIRDFGGGVLVFLRAQHSPDFERNVSVGVEKLHDASMSALVVLDSFLHSGSFFCGHRAEDHAPSTHSGFHVNLRKIAGAGRFKQ